MQDIDREAWSVVSPLLDQALELAEAARAMGARLVHGDRLYPLGYRTEFTFGSV